MPSITASLFSAALVGRAVSLRRHAERAAAKPAWKGGVCWWSETTDECHAFTSYKPGAYNVPQHKCHMKTSNESKAMCESRVGRQGLPCKWENSEWCKEEGCDDFQCDEEEACKDQYEQAKCEARPLALNCEWDGWSCISKNAPPPTPECREKEAEAECLGGGTAWPCSWRDRGGWGPLTCRDVRCWDIYNESACSAQGTIQGLDRKEHCMWDGEKNECERVSECLHYEDSESCNADEGKVGNCAWNAQESTSCKEVKSCTDYAKAAACSADAFGIASRMYEGAQCWWRETKLQVGKVIKVDLYSDPLPTSRNLEIRFNELGDNFHTLHLIDGYSYDLERYLGIGYLEQTPVHQVLDAEGTVRSLDDIPAPVPDDFTIVFSDCRDNLPKVDYTKADRTCHPISSKAACDIAEEQPECDKYFCSSNECWHPSCKGCSFCGATTTVPTAAPTAAPTPAPTLEKPECDRSLCSPGACFHPLCGSCFFCRG